MGLENARFKKESTLMSTLAFYWRGSTAANISSLSWDTLTNWRLLTYSATAGYVVAPATRLPMGGDQVNFGTWYGMGVTAHANLTVLSPCLFGGVTTASTSWWSGATAGSSLAQKHGTISAYAFPNYPFSKLGGKIDEQILEEWTRNLQVQFWLGSSVIATGPNQWTLSSGTEYVDASYVSQWYGATVGISYGNQPAYAIRFRGFWADGSKYGTMTTLVGVTGNTAGAGGTGAFYDGSFNRVDIRNVGIPLHGSSSTSGNFGTLPGQAGIGPFGFSFATETPAGDVYRHGSIELSGHWNSVSSGQATRDAKIILTNAKVNAVALLASYAQVFTSTGPGSRLTGITQTWFDLDGFYMDKDSTARVVQIANLETMTSPVVIHGDITDRGGFVCAAPAGVSAGASGGILLPNGSMQFSPPLYRTSPTDAYQVILGYPSSEGTKQTTAINHFYAENPSANYGNGFTYSIAGNYTGTNFWLKNGTVAFDEQLPSRATIEITNLSLQGDSVFDATPASPGFQGTANITIVPATNLAVVKPGAGNQLSMATLFSLNG